MERQAIGNSNSNRHNQASDCLEETPHRAFTQWAVQMT